ncbi:hypothetical protein SEPCBS57363_004975 [Sporothrix epigloea]|uniref:Uncharacterized protein n=1 Tax=Sporothrix epigloea TaxID=1892477 RepID=A0ABP0DV23_9PEZI
MADSDSEEAGAFFRPTSTALLARRSPAVVDKSVSRHGLENSGSVDKEATSSCIVASQPRLNLDNIPNITNKSEDANNTAEQNSSAAAALQTAITADDDCAIEDDDDDVNNNLGDEEDLWEDDDGMSYNAHGSAVIKTAFAVRPNQLRKKHQRGSAKVLKQDSSTLFLGGTVKYARHPDGSLISNLSQQLRQAAQLADLAAPTCSELITPKNKEESSRTTTPENIAADTVSPPATCAAQLPDPLRCYPITVTPPPTPPEIGPQSPNPPPPVPPSTPQVALTRRSRFGSTSSLRPLLTPPLTPTAATATMATAVATILSSSGSTTSTIALMAASSGSSGTASTRATSVSSVLSNATPKQSLVTVPPKNPILHIAQIKRPTYKARNGVNFGGGPNGFVAYNGYSGPRLEPFINLDAQVSLDSSSALSDSAEEPCLRRKLIRSASSGLIASEMTDSLQRQILNENKSRYIFQHFGTRRFVDLEPNSAARPSPFQRSMSMQNVSHEPLLTEAEIGKGKAAARGPNGHPHPVFRQVYFVDDYKEPEDWTWERGYHTKGW